MFWGQCAKFVTVTFQSVTLALANKEKEVSDYERRLQTAQDEVQTVSGRLAELEAVLAIRDKEIDEQRSSADVAKAAAESQLHASEARITELETDLRRCREDLRDMEEQRVRGEWLNLEKLHRGSLIFIEFANLCLLFLRMLIDCIRGRRIRPAKPLHPARDRILQTTKFQK